MAYERSELPERPPFTSLFGNSPFLYRFSFIMLKPYFKRHNSMLSFSKPCICTETSEASPLSFITPEDF